MDEDPKTRNGQTNPPPPSNSALDLPQNQFGKYAKMWMDIGNCAEKLGSPVLLSAFFGLISIPIAELKFFHSIFSKFFSNATPSSLVFATWTFALFLTVCLLLERKRKTSLKSLANYVRAFKRLHSDGTITAEQRMMATQFAVVSLCVHKLSDNPRFMERCLLLLEKPEIKALLDLSVPTDASKPGTVQVN